MSSTTSEELRDLTTALAILGKRRFEDAGDRVL